jgi:hypothetical protein
LARTCLGLNQPVQAASVCSQLLEHTAGADRQPILELLADAYRAQGRYGRAVAALLDSYDVTDPNGVHLSPGAVISR